MGEQAPAGGGRVRRPVDLTNSATLRGVVRRVGLHRSPRLGQHFLVDRAVLEAIADALAPSPGDEVLEIGCGVGTLTGELAGRGAHVLAIDVDPACVEATRITQRDRPTVRVLQMDAREADPAALGLAPGWLACGNLPYHLTGTLLQRLFERADTPVRAVFLVQREVAARLAAAPGDWSLATVAMRSIASVERLADVPPHAFDPAPAVHSSIIRLAPSAGIDLEARAAVLDLARPLFQARRKTLRNGVARVCGGDAAVAMRLLDVASIDSGRRPGTLGLDEWQRLAAAVATLRRGSQ